MENYKTEVRRVSELKHHPISTEMYILSDIETLKENIELNGLLVPLVIDQYNQVISGNRRLECLFQLGWDKVDVQVVEVKNEEDLKYLVYSFNKHRKKSTSESINEIYMLKDYYSVGSGYKRHVNQDGTFQLIDWRKSASKELGISTGLLDHYLNISNHPEYWNEIDQGFKSVSGVSSFIKRQQKKDKQTNTKIINIGNLIDEQYKVFNKSSVDMSEINDGTIQTIFTSPPYFNLRVYGEPGLGNEHTPDEYIKNLSSHLDECYRVLNENGSFFLNLGDSYVGGCLQSIPHRVVLELITRKGWILKNTIVWKKKNYKPNPTKRGLTPTYEFVFHLVKTLDYVYQPTEIPTKGVGKKSSRPNDRTETYYRESDDIVVNEFKNMGDFLTDDILQTCVVTQSKFRGMDDDHPAMFPNELVTPFILQTSNEGDTILDPFIGSGTTLEVGLELGRKVIGYELNSNYVNSINKRHKLSQAS